MTSGTYTVPASIDATGSSNVSSALASFIASVPNGSVIVFRPGTYQLDQALVLTGRSNLILRGNGTTLHSNNPGTQWRQSPIVLANCQHITVEGFTEVGNNTNTTTIWNGAENQHGLHVEGGSYIEFTGNTVSQMNGDLLYVMADYSSHVPATHVWIHDNTGSYLGRNGISVISAIDLLVEHNNLTKIGYHVFDIEPDLSYESVDGVTFRDNTIGDYGHITSLIGYFFQVYSPQSPSVRNITVTGNTVVGGTAGYHSIALGLNSKSVIPSPRVQNIVFRDNSTTHAVAGPAFVWQHVDGIDYRGNTQPLSSGSLASVTDCTGVVRP